jgi:hypothetical protein
LAQQGAVQNLDSPRSPRANQATNSSGWTRAEGVFAAVAVFTILGITFGLVGIYKSIRRPFVPNASVLALANVANSGDTTAELQNRDTDEDGLSDFDELYQYQTSPYLADSDSDALSDKEELESGNDPNCPTGLDCTGFGSSLNVNTTTGTTNTSTNSVTNSATNTAGTGIPTTASGDVDMAQLREVLKNSGAPAYIVDSTDDATLLELYQESLAEQNTGTANSNSTNSATNSQDVSLDSLNSLSSAEIRALLIQNGVDEALLTDVSDDELKSIFQDAVQSQSGS